MTVPARRFEIATAESFYTRPDVVAGAPGRVARMVQRAALRRLNGEAEAAQPMMASRSRLSAEPAPTGTAALAWQLFGPEGVEPPPDDAISGEIAAYVNEARWVADCPDKRCNAAQVVTPDDPRYLCAVCGNLANGRKWFAVTFPAPAQRTVIEALISARPRVENVNWTPDESVEDVQRINLEHGVSVEVA